MHKPITPQTQSPCCCPQNQQQHCPSSMEIQVQAHAVFQLDLVKFENQQQFLMGSEDTDINILDGEGPVRQVTLSPFAIASKPISNAEFQQFIDATAYVTQAEQFGGSYVFFKHLQTQQLQHYQAQHVAETPWWVYVEHAAWHSPEGKGSTIQHRLDHPVVHISWHDAQAFCQWAKLQLPTEAQWEFAARGGLIQQKYAWGDTFQPNGQLMCNTWQGRFPDQHSGQNTPDTGYLGTSPIGTFPANNYGLYDVAGNVWEWCADYFSTRHLQPHLHDPKGPETGKQHVLKGGSFLCHDSYCNRYRVAARTANTPNSSASNIGFRCVSNPE
jgi:Uncharacterized conserved protein